MADVAVAGIATAPHCPQNFADTLAPQVEQIIRGTSYQLIGLTSPGSEGMVQP